ncbi:tRNA (N(6)-L-threonylcarbamoyladenosine(37)-C(2))-methylthiotransferase MtaB [Sphingomonas carotinifaciens]|uniref:tRNA (N(6)-L-threonylcarbamoyladenosine(37)-C(2))- methylthiotransferase MtaB n=1 Tax=Sphingomonas carotinifaciens TaxID=1166323 RepID=UPI000DDC05D0|nr:tRNA (N(6)-L-threonylcarbamoyladenosine(37)-C(2))-methylthiotransferase MtaB [Sphingomonas carotinifaciens]
MSASPAPEVVSLGCRLNIAESETIRALLGATEDTVVVNSCAVTNEAVKQTRAAIRRAARARPGARIVVTGCAAEIDPHSFTAMPEVSRVVRNPDKLRPESWGALPSATRPVAFGQHARAFVEVQNGCDHACTFCIIPAGRGPSRSLPAGGVVDQIARAVDAGHNEVVLTGVDLTSYGHDLPGRPTLGSLVERILTFVPALRRLRLSSLDSVEIDARLFDLVTGEARVMPHLHLSLQAGNDLILKRMKRRHSRAQSVEIVQQLLARRPEIAIGADLIAGFPTEDDAMAADTLALVEDCRIVHAHIFPYSARTGTPAARMPQVPHDLRRARAAALRDAAGRARAAWLAAQVGGRQEVLVERPGTTGHTPGFATVHLDSPAPLGTIAPVRVTGATDTHLIGTRL